MNKVYRIAGKTVNEFDYYFFKYLSDRGDDGDQVLAYIVDAIGHGNGQYIIELHELYGFKNIIEMSNFVIKAKPRINKIALSNQR